MSLYGILRYSLRAGAFALIVTAAAAVLLAMDKRRRRSGSCGDTAVRLIFVFYLAALIQITVIREWSAFFSFASQPHSAASLQLILLRTTIAQWRRGAWPFLYHVLGNMVWFAPVGLIGPLMTAMLRQCRLAALTGACLSVFIELSQWIFATGASDIDDVLLNALGAVGGWLIWKAAVRLRIGQK